MAMEFRLPDIGEGVAEGEIVQWLVNVGDTIAEDQALVEVMTDKVTAEIPSPYNGVVKELRGNPGDVINVGTVIVVLDEPGSSSAPTSKKDAPKAETPKPASKKPSTAPAPSGGNGKHHANPPAAATGGKVLAAPATRKLAREQGVDIAALSGTGPRGRITPDDVRQAAESTGGGTAVASPPATQTPKQPAIKTTPKPCPLADKTGEERIPFTGMRRKIGEHLVKSKQTAPHFAYVEEVDMTELVGIRQQLKPDAEAQGVKLTYLPFIIKSVIQGLRAFPMVNASLDDDAQEIIYKYDYNIGVAIATDQGLIVPVIHRAQDKSLFELAAEIQTLSEAARTGKLKLEQLQGGTFTLTSIGSIGGVFGIPIINHPEVGILGINKITKRPMVIETNGVDEIAIRHMMNLSLSCDHRVVDGAEGALFVKRIIEYLEAPVRLLV